MKRVASVLTLILLAGLIVVTGLCAAETGGAAEKTPQAITGSAVFFAVTVASAGLCIALAAAFCGLAQGRAIDKSMESLARQPEISGDLRTNLILGLAFIESLAIYALLISIILLMANPFVKYFVQ